MVTCNLRGGLGNMMFQIAAIEDMGRRTGLETIYPNVNNNFAELIKYASHSKGAFDYLKIFKNFNWYKNKDKEYVFTQLKSIPHKYIQIKPEDNTIYDGYFQSERYFNRAETLKLFEPANFIVEEVEKWSVKDTCSIHIRRGDYINKYKDTYEEPGMEYYLEAIKYINAKQYYIFSDDLPWCVDNFSESHFIYVGCLPDYMILFLMSRCKYNIIANSSFSWWGAYLNQNPDKKVIAPSKWYKGYKYSAMDIYCDNWKII